MAKRLSINLSDEVGAVLEQIAKEDGVTVTEVVRRSISTEKFLRDAVAKGERVLLMEPDTEKTREILLFR